MASMRDWFSAWQAKAPSKSSDWLFIEGYYAEGTRDRYGRKGFVAYCASRSGMTAEEVLAEAHAAGVMRDEDTITYRVRTEPEVCKPHFPWACLYFRELPGGWGGHPRAIEWAVEQANNPKKAAQYPKRRNPPHQR